MADEVTVLVRGGLPDADLLREDAVCNHANYASYGISVVARDVTVEELAQQAH